MKLSAFLMVGLVTLSLAASAVMAKDKSDFQLTSPDIKGKALMDNKFVFNGFGCSGGNLSPALNWTGAPQGTKSFAVLVQDPDAPTGGAGWWHWVAYNIPADATGLVQGAGTVDGAKLPKGSVQGKTDFGAAGWGGPCPPQGDKPHHYNITVYALKVDKLDIPLDATASLVGFMANANAIAKAKLTGMFGRK